MAQFEFEIHLNEAVSLPADKGSCLHGAFGEALARLGLSFRDYFFNPQPPPHWRSARQAPPRPYILIPPLTDKTDYAAGESLNFGIVLFGAAIAHFMLVFAAFSHLGEFMGLGPQRGRFRIEQVQQLSAAGAVSLYQQPHWLGEVQTLNSQLILSLSPPAVSRINVQHFTRLRLKAENQLLTTPPAFHLLLQRLISRINALAALYGNGVLLEPDEKHALLAEAETVRIESSTLQWRDWQRYSQRSNSAMPFGGLLGETVYAGELAPFVPWLSLGQWTGVGGKTSFGLGLYELSY